MRIPKKLSKKNAFKFPEKGRKKGKNVVDKGRRGMVIYISCLCESKG